MKKLAILPPDFGLRLAQKADKKLIRVLSLCSGAARIESSFARSVKNPVHFTLFDLNEKLLDSAKSQFPDTCQVETVCGDINQISDFGKRFDIIICVSALHHVVELEKVCKFINDTLVSNGELWVIGEYIGRNGNRLWPEDYLIANEFFKKLPKKYRINNFRNKHVDVDLPDDDSSVNSFEGIRSQDIEACLELYFDELKALKFNCLLWRLIDLVYVDNYNIKSEYDRRIIEMAVDLEINRFQSGGRPAELFGIYTLRHDMKSNLTDHIDEQL